MTRPHDWSAFGLCFDPIPGCPDTVERHGRGYLGTAQTVEQAAQGLRRLRDQAIIRSKAVTAVLDKAENLACKFDAVGHRYEEAGQALLGYAPHLRAAQVLSVQARHEAQAAREATDRYQHERNSVVQQWRSSGGGPDNDLAFSQQVHATDARGAQATAALAAAKCKLQQAIRDRDCAANAAARRIDCAVETSQVTDNLVAEVFGAIVKFIWDNIDVIVLALSIAALFIPGGAVISALLWSAKAVSMAKSVADTVAAAKKGDGLGVGLGLASIALGAVGGKAAGNALLRSHALPTSQVKSALKVSARRAGVKVVGRGPSAVLRVAKPTTVSRIADATTGRLFPSSHFATQVLPHLDMRTTIGKTVKAQVIGSQLVGAATDFVTSGIPSAPRWIQQQLTPAQAC